jgi:hypothetical protein
MENTTEMTEQKQTAIMFADMASLWNEFETSHNDYSAKGTKKSAAKARKAIQSLKSMVTAYKKASVEECKA